MSYTDSVALSVLKEFDFMNRRGFLLGGTAMVGSGALALGGTSWSGGATAASAGVFEVVKSEAEWRKILSPQQYRILREEGTEYAHSSPLLNEKRAGNFVCAGCGWGWAACPAKVYRTDMA